MAQEDVIRSEAAHEVKMTEGGGSATSTQGTSNFDQRRRVIKDGPRQRAPQRLETVWAEVEDAWSAPTPSDWAVRPARVTHMGRPPAKREDFRGPLKALRAKNAEVRERLNRVMAPIR